MQEDDNSIIYANIVEDLQSELPEITVQCNFSRLSHVQTAFRPHSSVSITSKEYGSFTIVLQQYTSADFTETISDTSEPEVSLGY